MASSLLFSWTLALLTSRLVLFTKIFSHYRYKFKGKPVYVSAYKNLAELHDMTFSGLGKRYIKAVIDTCPLSV